MKLTLLQIKDARIVRLTLALRRIAKNKCHHNTAPCCTAWRIAEEALKQAKFIANAEGGLK